MSHLVLRHLALAQAALVHPGVSSTGGALAQMRRARVLRSTAIVPHGNGLWGSCSQTVALDLHRAFAHSFEGPGTREPNTCTGLSIGNCRAGCQCWRFICMCAPTHGSALNTEAAGFVGRLATCALLRRRHIRSLHMRREVRRIWATQSVPSRKPNSDPFNMGPRTSRHHVVRHAACRRWRTRSVVLSSRCAASLVRLVPRCRSPAAVMKLPTITDFAATPPPSSTARSASWTPGGWRCTIGGVWKWSSRAATS